MAGENYINHVGLVLDASLSMRRNAADLIRVADEQVKYLARRSQELDQETRVTIYTFSDPHSIRCLVYDKDVLRLPSIATLYQTGGNTALIDATVQALRDLSETPERYGDHSFLIYVLTDGRENRSRTHPRDLATQLATLHENWTVAVLVPDQLGKREAQQFGFPRDNIAIWDPTAAQGVEEAGNTIQRATENFMQARAKGVRGSRSLFSTGADVVNATTVKSTLAPIPEREYDVIKVHENNAEIRDFVQSRGLDYRIGNCFYQLVRRTTASGYAHASEKVQPEKHLLVREKATGRVYGGPDARALLGLPSDREVRVRQEQNPDYDVFIQSTSVNRQLVQGTDLVVLRRNADLLVGAGSR